MSRSRYASPRSLSYECLDVGRTIKATKRRATWKFGFEGSSEEHAVVLVHSVVSGKKQVFVDGNQAFEEQKVRGAHARTARARRAAAAAAGEGHSMTSIMSRRPLPSPPCAVGGGPVPVPLPAQRAHGAAHN